MNADMDITQCRCEAECQLEIDRAFESLINEIEERKQVIKASTAEQCRLLNNGYAKQKEELKTAQGEIAIFLISRVGYRLLTFQASRPLLPFTYW